MKCKTVNNSFKKLLFLFSAMFGMIFTSSQARNISALEANAICQGIANDENNNIAETKAQGNPVPRYRTLLKYDDAFASEGNSNNVVSTTGKGIKLNGVSLDKIPNSLVDYANGSKYIRIKIPTDYQDSLVGTIVLEVVAGTTFEGKVLDGIKFTLINNKWESVKNVSYQEIEWNDIGYKYYSSMSGVLLKFSANLSNKQSEIDAGIQSTNFASTVGEHIYLGGIKISTLPGAFVSYHSQGLLFIYADNMVSYRTIKIEQDTVFLNANLPEVNLYYDVSNKWSTNPKSYTEVTYSKIEWNNLGYKFYASMSGVLIEFSDNLSKKQTEKDGGIQSINFTQCVGDHILLGGNKLSTLPGAFVSFHSNKLLFIYANNMTSYRQLTIEADTKFIDASLPELNLYFNSDNKWSIDKEPAQLVTLSTILWNNIGHDVYAGKKGVLLSYSSNLSFASNEIHGDIKTVNQVSSEIGLKVKLDGVPFRNIEDAEIMYFGSTFLWIYAPNMQFAKELKIETVEFLSVLLPNSYFRLFDNEWAESIKITSIVNGVEKIDYCKKTSGTVLGESYYASLFKGEGLALRLVSFEVNDTIYKPTQTLKVSSDTIVKVIGAGFETTSGAAIRISDKADIRFESRINKSNFDYLVSKYGSANIEVGTYIIPRDSLSLKSFDGFIGDASNVEGVDYVKSVNTSFANSSTASQDGFYKYYGSLNGVLESDYCTEYCGIGYIKIIDGQATHTLYGGDKFASFSRSVYDVIRFAFGDYANGTYKREQLVSYLNGILPLVSTTEGIEIENVVEGYTSPYSLNYNNETGEYTVTGNSKINLILLNGKEISQSGSFVVVGETTYITNNLSLHVEENSSVLKFKLAPIVSATELVDFTVRFPAEREMRILQITDTQIIDSSQMRTADRLGAGAVLEYSRPAIDKRCYNHIAALIEKEQPDLILFTGDIVYGSFDDSGVILTEMINFMDSFDIPWAPIFGNHDNESTIGVAWQCAQYENAKNCLFKKGNVTGNGNYSIGLVDSNGKIRRVIYMLDSQGCLTGPGIANDQIAWMNTVGATIDETYGEQVPAFACYHVPSLDFKKAIENKYKIGETDLINLDQNGQSGDFGQKNEKMSIFNTAIASYLRSSNVDAVFAGHDHVNNFSISYEGIRYTYGTKTGTYDYYNPSILGGTMIKLTKEGAFNVAHTFVNETEITNRKAISNTVTIMSDLHVDSRDYDGFYCTKSITKLNKIIKETKDSKFYINLGDTVNSCSGSLKNYYDAMSAMSANNLNIYNSKGTGYVSGNRMIYNLLGNHEVAYSEKNAFKDYVPYVENVGSAGVFKQDDMMFVAVDALFTRLGSDNPSDIITCTQFMIPENEINYLTAEVARKMDSSIKGIVWISHVALQDIDEGSKGTLLSALKTYGLPMTVFEGHTHIEAYKELKDTATGNTYCQVYTLPAVTLYNKYPYYNVTFKDGKVWGIAKRTTGEL